jgi:hypothetical protein
MEKRALLEIDRERTTSAKLQKALESERSAHAAASERLRADHSAAQAMIGQLREQVGSLQNAVDTSCSSTVSTALASTLGATCA